MPARIEHILGMKDIFLGSQKHNEARMKQLRTGSVLVPDSTHFTTNEAPGLAAEGVGNVLIYASGFLNGTLPRFASEGYTITGGSVAYIVQWWNKEERRNYEVVLPSVWLTREGG